MRSLLRLLRDCASAAAIPSFNDRTDLEFTKGDKNKKRTEKRTEDFVGRHRFGDCAQQQCGRRDASTAPFGECSHRRNMILLFARTALGAILSSREIGLCPGRTRPGIQLAAGSIEARSRTARTALGRPRRCQRPRRGRLPSQTVARPLQSPAVATATGHTPKRRWSLRMRTRQRRLR